MSIPKLSVNNPVVSNLLMAMVIALGVYAWITLPRDLIPEIVTYTARISTFYPGASAETATGCGDMEINSIEVSCVYLYTLSRISVSI